ncbi:unnamed protein product [Caenorhabditis nigoni]
MRQEIKEHPMDGSSTRMTGGSSANGQAGEQSIWLDPGMCQQHLEDGCSEATHALLIAISFLGRLIDVIEVILLDINQKQVLRVSFNDEFF